MRTQPLPSDFDSPRIAVERHDAPRGQAFQDGSRVPAGSRGRVHVDSVGFDRQPFHYFLRQHWDVHRHRLWRVFQPAVRNHIPPPGPANAP